MNQAITPQAFVLSLGGSLIAPKEGIAVDYLRKFGAFIRRQVNDGKRFFIVCGGGFITRQYQQAAREIVKDLTEGDADLLGILCTKLNARLVLSLFKDVAYPQVLEDYSDINSAVSDCAVVIGAGWKPGCSSDFEAVLLAEKFKVRTLINLSNIKAVYDKDPSKFADAKPLKELSWAELRQLTGQKWTPGLNTPFDPVAAEKAEKLDLRLIVCHGQDLDNLEQVIIGGKFAGTVVEAISKLKCQISNL